MYIPMHALLAYDVDITTVFTRVLVYPVYKSTPNF